MEIFLVGLRRIRLKDCLSAAVSTAHKEGSVRDYLSSAFSLWHRSNPARLWSSYWRKGEVKWKR